MILFSLGLFFETVGGFQLLNFQMKRRNSIINNRNNQNNNEYNDQNHRGNTNTSGTSSDVPQPVLKTGLWQISR